MGKYVVRRSEQTALHTNRNLVECYRAYARDQHITMAEALYRISRIGFTYEMKFGSLSGRRMPAKREWTRLVHQVFGKQSPKS